MKVGIVKESYPDEKRVALIPASIPALTKAALEVVLEKGAGLEAGFPDPEYTEKGARILGTRSEVYSTSDIILQIRTYGANKEAGRADLELAKQGQIHIGLMEPLTELEAIQELAKRGVTTFSMEMMPRITRAQSMDVLSSMASLAGYKAVLDAAGILPRIFPMMMTAAGTLAPAKVFVIGAGVAGLQAISTAKRLGAVVRAFDVRAAVKEQIQSLGGKFVEFDLGVSDAEDKGGYARELSEEQKTETTGTDGRGDCR